MSPFALITHRSSFGESMKPRAVIFDMDGVLIDARDWHFEALNSALEIFGFEITLRRHLDSFNGRPTREKLNLLSIQDGLPIMLHGVIEAIKQERTLRIASARNKPTLEHLILLGWLKSKGVKIGVATNSIRMTSEFMLSWAGILPLLDVLITNQDVEIGKPSPDIYLKAAAELGFEPGDCVAVEDSELGAKAASSAGMSVIRVDNPSDVSLQLFENRIQ